MALGIKIRILNLTLHITLVYLSGPKIPPLHHSALSYIGLHPVSQGTLFLPALEIHLCFFLCPGAIFPFYCVLTFQLKLPQTGQLHGLATWAAAQGLHLEGLHAWFNVLLSQSWNSFEQRAPHFHFALGHRNYVASFVLRKASTDLPKYFKVHFTNLNSMHTPLFHLFMVNIFIMIWGLFDCLPPPLEN